ncbi:MAG: cysteine desulfurase [Armatimonadetes bacterium RBG_16_58_9]|nr:MAG: cysteine desulfurase [Armatimonadetes bacterium RBG_16_58_9]
MIYLDNAATSWPKPPEVKEAMIRFLDTSGGNPGRSGHQMSVDAGRVVYQARESIAKLLGASDPLRVIFTMNATHAINIALVGILKPGDRVVTTGMEHNSVMRPLRELERKGTEVAVVPCDPNGMLNISALEETAVGARMVVVNHASNVVGTIQDIETATRIAHAAGAVMVVDAAQTAGAVPTDVDAIGVDLLAFAGHKGVLGPSGTGGLVIGSDFDVDRMEPLMRGGTGSNSGREHQPEYLPDKYESGTSNGVGIAGLGAGARFVLDKGVESVRKHGVALTKPLTEGLKSIKGVRLYGPRDPEERTAVVSFTINGASVSQIGLRFQEDFGIMCRVGLHCAPAAHKTIGTYPEGTVRLSPGLFTTVEQVEQTVEAVERIARQ